MSNKWAESYAGDINYHSASQYSRALLSFPVPGTPANKRLTADMLKQPSVKREKMPRDYRLVQDAEHFRKISEYHKRTYYKGYRTHWLTYEEMVDFIARGEKGIDWNWVGLGLLVTTVLAFLALTPVA